MRAISLVVTRNPVAGLTQVRASAPSPQRTPHSSPPQSLSVPSPISSSPSPSSFTSLVSSRQARFARLLLRVAASSRKPGTRVGRILPQGSCQPQPRNNNTVTDRPAHLVHQKPQLSSYLVECLRVPRHVARISSHRGSCISSRVSRTALSSLSWSLASSLIKALVDTAAGEAMLQTSSQRGIIGEGILLGNWIWKVSATRTGWPQRCRGGFYRQQNHTYREEWLGRKEKELERGKKKKKKKKKRGKNIDGGRYSTRTNHPPQVKPTETCHSLW